MIRNTSSTRKSVSSNGQVRTIFSGVVGFMNKSKSQNDGGGQPINKSKQVAIGEEDEHANAKQ